MGGGCCIPSTAEIPEQNNSYQPSDGNIVQYLEDGVCIMCDEDFYDTLIYQLLHTIQRALRIHLSAIILRNVAAIDI